MAVAVCVDEDEDEAEDGASCSHALDATVDLQQEMLQSTTHNVTELVRATTDREPDAAAAEAVVGPHGLVVLGNEDGRRAAHHPRDHHQAACSDIVRKHTHYSDVTLDQTNRPAHRAS